MPGLLDYIIQDYQNGGHVNPFDPAPTPQDYLSEYDIELTDPSKTLPFLPKPDPMGRQFDITNYMQDRQGIYAGGRGALGQAGQKSRETAAGQGFAGAGKSLLDTTRGDIVDEFGRQSQKAYSGLQQDVYERERREGEEFLAAIGDLPEDAYTMGDHRNVTTNQGVTIAWNDDGTPSGDAAFGDSILNSDTGVTWFYYAGGWQTF